VVSEKAGSPGGAGVLFWIAGLGESLLAMAWPDLCVLPSTQRLVGRNKRVQIVAFDPEQKQGGVSEKKSP
jgi:hypothetical protein